MNAAVSASCSPKTKMDRHGDLRWMGEQIRRLHFGEQLALHDVHVSQGSDSAEDAVSSKHRDERFAQ
jgi:hypothetical protein